MSKKKKNWFSKLMVVLIIILNVIFTQKVLDAYVQVGNEPVALIGAWFAFTTGELWMLTNIKKTRIKKEEKENQNGTV